MSNPRGPEELNQVQRWMLSVITHPRGVIEGLDSEAARRQIDVGPEDVEAVITRSQHLSSLDRLQVYANAYYVRLIECLQDEFPALYHALGEETFNGFALAYLQAHPPGSYTLNQLGAHFPRFLRETRPANEADARDRPNWTDFLIDLATLERTYSEVFDGPGPEGKPLLEAEDIAAVPPERWPEARLIPDESLRLVELSYPVHEYASAVRRGQSSAVPQPEPTWLVVSRWDYIVRRRAIPRPAFELLQRLVSGHPVGEAIADVANGDGIDADRLAEQLHAWFRDWTAAGYFHRVEW